LSPKRKRPTHQNFESFADSDEMTWEGQDAVASRVAQEEGRLKTVFCKAAQLVYLVLVEIE